MTTFELQPTDHVVTFAYWLTGPDGPEFGPEQMIVITDCFTDYQAEQKFWQLCGEDHEGVCMFDCYQAEETPEKYMFRLEKDAITEHLFGTTQFGQTDVALLQKYSDHG